MTTEAQLQSVVTRRVKLFSLFCTHSIINSITKVKLKENSKIDLFALRTCALCNKEFEYKQYGFDIKIPTRKNHAY